MTAEEKPVVLHRAWLKLREVRENGSVEWPTKSFRLMQGGTQPAWLEIAQLRFPDSPERVVAAAELAALVRPSAHQQELASHETSFDLRLTSSSVLSIGLHSVDGADTWVRFLVDKTGVEVETPAEEKPQQEQQQQQQVPVETPPSSSSASETNAQPASAPPPNPDPVPSQSSGKSRVRKSLPKFTVNIWDCDSTLFQELTTTGVPDELAAYALLQTNNRSAAEARAYLQEHPLISSRIDIELQWQPAASLPTSTSSSSSASKTTTSSTRPSGLRRTIGQPADHDDGHFDDNDDDLLNEDELEQSEDYLVGSGSELAFSDGDEHDEHGFAPVDLHSSTGGIRRGRNTLTASGIDIARQTAVLAVAGRLSVPEWFATALLVAHFWDTDKTIERYLGDAEAVQRELGIDLQQQEMDDQQAITCSICWDESTDNAHLPCGHSFCQECFVGQIESGLNEGKSVDINCLGQGCLYLIPEYLVQKLAPPATYARYSSFANNAFVATQKGMKWCPRPGCPNAVYDPIQERNCLAGYCACGFRFCFACNREAHSPITCDVMSDWQRKLDADAATMLWIQENTKACPQCGVGIQKNDGCFQMTCSHCKAQWCWLCQKPWSTHPNHFRCNTFDESVLSNRAEYRDGTGPKTDTRALRDFTSMLELYNEHSKSSVFEQHRRNALRAKIETIRDDSSRVFDTEFLPAAHNQLAQLRSVLKFSFVEAWHLKTLRNVAEETNEAPAKIEELNTLILLRQLQQDQLSFLAEKFTSLLGDPELFAKLDINLAADIRGMTGAAKQQVQNFLR